MDPKRVCAFIAPYFVGILVAACASAVPAAPPHMQAPAPTPVDAPTTNVSQAPPEPVVCALASDLPALPAAKFDQESGQVSRSNLQMAVDALADPALHGRDAGSPDNRRVARWIAKRFAEAGLSPPPGTDHCVPFERNQVKDQNVIAHLHRSARADAPVVLVGAHYDAQGHRDESVFPGADDNASGVAALLEIARLCTKLKKGPDMVFVAFGAEERGLLGAKAYVDAPSIALSRITLMINLDMVGRPMLDGSPMRFFISRANETIGYVIGNREKGNTNEILQRAAAREERPIIGIPEIVLTRLGFGSDSVPFSPHVPTIFLSTGDHADYHQPTDTAEKLDFDQLTRAVQLTLAIIDEAVATAGP
jgi:hypothetical protein